MADDNGPSSLDASAMTAIAITTSSCHSCGRGVEDAMHVMLCDRCLDARLAQPKPMPVRALGAAVFAALERRAPIAA
jgi:hypothetical protein